MKSLLTLIRYFTEISFCFNSLNHHFCFNSLNHDFWRFKKTGKIWTRQLTVLHWIDQITGTVVYWLTVSCVYPDSTVRLIPNFINIDLLFPQITTGTSYEANSSHVNDNSSLNNSSIWFSFLVANLHIYWYHVKRTFSENVNIQAIKRQRFKWFLDF